jgi:2-methylcitrate dehydratase PrpD
MFSGPDREGILGVSVLFATIAIIREPIAHREACCLNWCPLALNRAPMDAPTPSAFSRVSDLVVEAASLRIPDHARHFASLLLLDALGVAAAATAMQPAQIARQTAALLYGTGTAPSARMLFDGRGVSVAGAAFAGAAGLDNLDAHDGCNPTKGHIGVVAIPALLAFAQSVPPVAASAAIAALVIGYEIGARAGIALHATASDYHSSGAWNAMAVAAIGACLRRSSGGQLRDALGIAEYHGLRSQMMRVIDHPTMLHDGSCWGALAGASAVFLAELGFTGAPASTLESEAVQPIWRDIGETWFVASQYIKPYPVCRWAHPLVDAALRLRDLHQLAAENIVGIELTTFRESSRLYRGMPDSSPVAQYSIAFPVAAALVAGKLGRTEVDGPALSDPRIQRLVEATYVREPDLFNRAFPADRCGEVTLLLRDGQRIASGATSARGGPNNPLNEMEIVAKFRDYAGTALGAARAARLEHAVRCLPERSGDFSVVIELACSGLG